MRCALLVPLLLAACGGGDEPDDKDRPSLTDGSTSQTTTPTDTDTPTETTSTPDDTGPPTVTDAGPYDRVVGGPCEGTTQPGVYAGPTVIRCIDVACDDELWTFTVLTDGWTRGGTVYVRGGGDDEEHDIASTSWDDDAWWDLLVEELPATSYLESVSTGLDCASDGPANLTVAIEVWDYTTDTLARCVVFGADPAVFTVEPRFASCDTWVW